MTDPAVRDVTPKVAAPLAPMPMPMPIPALALAAASADCCCVREGLLRTRYLTKGTIPAATELGRKRLDSREGTANRDERGEEEEEDEEEREEDEDEEMGEGLVIGVLTLGA